MHTATDRNSAVHRVEAQALRIAFGKEELLGETSFSLSPGDYLCIVGANGSGKTSLLKAFFRAVSPVSGSISLAGKDLALWRQRELGAFLAYVPQTLSLTFDSSVAHFLGETSDQYIDDLEVQSLRGKRMMNLSGGERQRVLLARALNQKPQLLLLDEVTHFADPGSERVLLKTVEEYRLRSSATVVSITHRRAQVTAYASHLLYLQRGQPGFFCGASGDLPVAVQLFFEAGTNE